MTRRSFLKMAAVTGAAVTIAAGGGIGALTEDAVAASGATEISRVRSTCRACGKCECGVWVTVRDGQPIKIEGDESDAHSRGHCCAKSQSSIQAAYHPDRLKYPMKRTNPKGDSDPGWMRITLTEAFDIAGENYKQVMDKYGGNAVFSMGGTSRVWSQAPYGTLKGVFGTSNFHSAYEICKGPRHFATLLTDERGGSWMEVEQEPKVYVQWGTAAEYSNYDSTNRTVNDVAAHAEHHILVDPRITPLGKEADIWLPLRIGTDLALSCTWLKWIIDNEAYDDAFVRRWTNGPFLYVEDKQKSGGWMMEAGGGIEMGTRLLTEADLGQANVPWHIDGVPSYKRFVCYDEANGKLTYWDSEASQWEGELHRIPTTGIWIEHPYKPVVADAWLPDISTFADPATEADRFPGGASACNPAGLPKIPALYVGGGIDVTFADGTHHRAHTAFEALCESLSEYTPEWAEGVTEVPADKIVEGVRAYATRVDPRIGNGGIHYQLAPDQTGHAIMNTRVLQLIACLTNNSDEPAGNRGSSKAQVDGCAGRADMLLKDYGDKSITWAGRDKTIEDQIPEIQEFVKYLYESKSPLLETGHYGNYYFDNYEGDADADGKYRRFFGNQGVDASFYKGRYGDPAVIGQRLAAGQPAVTDAEARIIAKRKGGDYQMSKTWPSPKTPFERNAGMAGADQFPLLRYWNSWSDATCTWEAVMAPVENHEDEIGYRITNEYPGEIHAGICMSGDFMNQSNLKLAWAALTHLDFWCDINLWNCPNNGNADVVFPCLHWLEVNTTRVSQGAGGLFGAGQRCKEPEGACIYDPVFVVCLWKAVGKKFNDKDPMFDGWLDLNVPDFVQEGGTVTYEEQESRVLKDACDAWRTEEYPDGPDFWEYADMFQRDGWFDCRFWHPERWGTYRRWEMGYRRQISGYNLYPAVDEHCAFMTPTGKVELWSTIIESYAYDDKTAAGLWNAMTDKDKLPYYRETRNTPVSAPQYFEVEKLDQIDEGLISNPHYAESVRAYGNDHTFMMTTGARQPVYFHSEHRQLPWCRELWPAPRFEINPADAARMGIEQGDWIWVESPWGKIREVAELFQGIKEGSVNANHAWWYPEIDEAGHGFDLVNINCIMDPHARCWICGATQLRGVPVVVYKATADNSPFGNPVPCDKNGKEVIYRASDPRLKEWLPDGEGWQTSLRKAGINMRGGE